MAGIDSKRVRIRTNKQTNKQTSRHTDIILIHRVK